MSLYGKPNANQGSVIGSLIPSSGLPVWLLAIAGYFAIMTVTNRVPALIYWIEGDHLKSEYMGYFIGTITSLLSVVALLLFLFRRYTLCIYYLVVTAILDLTVSIAAVAGFLPPLYKTEDFSSYFYSLQGLDSVPHKIVEWTVGWDYSSILVQKTAYIAGNIASFSFCALLLYFHTKSLPRGQGE